MSVMFWDPNRFDPSIFPWARIQMPFRTGDMTLHWTRRPADGFVFVWRDEP